MSNPDDLSQYWVDEESPYIEADTVAELIRNARIDELKRTALINGEIFNVAGTHVLSVDDRIAELSLTTELGS